MKRIDANTRYDCELIDGARSIVGLELTHLTKLRQQMQRPIFGLIITQILVKDSNG